MPGPASRAMRFYQREDGARVGAQVGFEVELAASQKDGDAVIADGAGQKNLVARANRSWINLQAGQGTTNAGGGDVHAIGFAVLDHLGVASGDFDAGLRARLWPWRGLRLPGSRRGSPASRMKVTTSASGWRPETARSLTVPLTASSPIEPPGKAQRLDDETVGGDGDPLRH